MGKVIKIFLHGFSAIILAAIILPLFFALMLYLPSVQTFAVKQAARYASKKLETTVSLDKVHIKFFNRVVIDGFYVEDYNKDTLLHVNKIDVGIPSLRIFKGNLMLGNVSLSGVRMNMYQEADSTSNFQKILIRLKNDKPEKKPFRIGFASLKIEDMSYHYNKLDIPLQEYGVNFSDIDVTGFNLDTENVLIDGDSIVMRINRIALEDKSGFRLDELSSPGFTISGYGMFFNGLHILTPESNINLDYLNLITFTWDGYKDFEDDVYIESSFDNSKIAFPTIAYFAQGLRNWNFEVEQFRGDMNGYISNFSGDISSARINSTEISTHVNIKGIPDIDNTYFDVNSLEITTNSGDINYIISEVTGKPLADNVNEYIDNLGSLSVSGNFQGYLNNFGTNGNIVTDEGRADFNMKFKPSGGNTSFAGNVNINGLHLGRVLDVKELGRIIVNAELSGIYGNQDFKASTKGKVAAVDYHGYRYRDIIMNGDLENRRFRGQIGSDDPNIDFDFNGILDFNDTIPSYDFGLELKNADLHQLNLNQRDTISILRANLNAHGTGASFDELNGKITIEDMLYVNHIDSIRTGEVNIVGENSSSSKYLGFYSSFADAEYRSRKSYSEVFKDLKEMFHTYMPTLSPGENPATAFSAKIGDASNYSLFNINIKEANNVAGIFIPGLMIAKGSRLSFMFNPDIEQFSLAASSDYIELRNNFISKLDINTRNQGDSISLFMRADDLYTAGIYMPDFSVIGSFKENLVNMTMRVQDANQRLSALIGMAGTLVSDTLSGRPQMRVRFTPSTINSGGRTWNIYTRGIVIDTAQIEVNNFTISGSGQSLIVDGIASSNKEDTLHITLSNFDMQPFSQLTNRMGYVVKGRSNGHADIVSAKKDGILHARILFDSVSINNIELPDGMFESTWDFERERARFALSETERGDTVIRGYYNPADSRYLADISMKNVDLSLLDPLFDGIIKNTTGKANIAARMTGARKNPLFNGTISVPSLTTTVDFLNVPYTLDNTIIDLKNNILSTSGVSLRDPYGNRADFSMNVDLSSLSNVSYIFEVVPNNLQVLNTTQLDSDLFYGTVFTSGSATIRGDKAGVNMNINAATSGDSRFYLPLSDNAASGISDIITFKTPEQEATDSTDYLFRKQLIVNSKKKIAQQQEQSNMNINMSLNVLPNTYFELIIDPRVGDKIKGNGSGNLIINVNPVTNEFTMIGDYEITRGSYELVLQDIFRKSFRIEEGSKISWTGDPADAILDVTAVYRLRTSLAPLMGSDDPRYRRTVWVECRIHLRDNLSQPSVSFSIDIPDIEPEVQIAIANELGTEENISTQFLYLLITNSFYANTGGANIGAAGGSATAIDFLSNQISNIISNDYFDIGIRYTPKSEIYSDEVMIDFSTQLFSERLLLEVEGNYDTQNNPGAKLNNTNNLTGDFALTWLIDKSGNLRAKGFTRTIDRFDENQGLQESGLGIYYKEDFDTFRDIVRNFRERFANWGRRKKKITEEEDPDYENVVLPVDATVDEIY